MGGQWQRGMRAGQSPANLQMRAPNMGVPPHTPEGMKRSADGKRSSKRSVAILYLFLFIFEL